MNRTAIMDGVKAKIDEVTPQGVSSPLEDLIGPAMNDCAVTLLGDLPSGMAPTETLPTTSMTRDTEGERAYIPVPEDYVKVARIRFSSWEKAVTKAIPIESADYILEENPYTRGGYARPRVWIGDFGLECSRVAPEDTVTEALYIKRLLPENLPDITLEALEWLTASVVLQIVNDGHEPQAYVNASKNARARYLECLAAMYGGNSTTTQR